MLTPSDWRNQCHRQINQREFQRVKVFPCLSRCLDTQKKKHQSDQQTQFKNTDSGFKSFKRNSSADDRQFLVVADKICWITSFGPVLIPVLQKKSCDRSFQ